MWKFFDYIRAKIRLMKDRNRRLRDIVNSHFNNMELLFDRLLVVLDDWLNSCDRRDDLRDLFSRDFFSQKDDYFQDEEESRDEEEYEDQSEESDWLDIFED